MNFSKSKIFISACYSFILGIALASFFFLEFFKEDFFIFICLVLVLILFVLFRKDKNWFFVFFIFLFFALGIWRYSFSLPLNSPEKIWFYNGNEVKIKGIIIEEPKFSLKRQQFILEAKEINNLEVDGKILVYASSYPYYKYGMELILNCKLKKPQKIENFSYDRYLAKSDIYSICYYPNILVNKNFSGSKFYAQIISFKSLIREKINQGSREPYSSLIRALVLGEKDTLPEDIKLIFSQVGISHIIAISGLHIGILVVMLFWFFIYLGLNRYQSFWLINIFLFFYLLLIGFPASAVRASIMSFFVLLAMYLGRLNKIYISLLLAACVILFINPRLLRDDIGFQLSFLAVLGILFLFPIIKNYLSKKNFPNFFMIRDLLAVSLAVQIFTFPILIFNFSYISLIAPITNLFVIWTLPFLLSFSLIAILLSFFFSGISYLFFLPVEFILSYILKISDFLVNIPFSYISF
jgi:competence protein ComEC